MVDLKVFKLSLGMEEYVGKLKSLKKLLSSTQKKEYGDQELNKKAGERNDTLVPPILTSRSTP